MKGSILDIPIIIIAIFMFAIVILLSDVILTEFDAATQNVTTSSGNKINATIMQKGHDAMATFDYAIIMAVIGLGLASVVFAFFIKSHPVLFGFTLILLMIFVFISSFFTNAYMKFIEVEPISTYESDYPIMYTVFQNLPLIISIIGIMILIALFSKNPFEQGGASYGI